MTNRACSSGSSRSTATDAAVPVVGLGLSITRAIVESRGGKLSFTSTEGKGTTFPHPIAVRLASVVIDSSRMMSVPGGEPEVRSMLATG